MQETITNNDKKFIIIGVGINIIKNPIFINYPTTNLLVETGLKITRFKLLNVIKKDFEKNLKKFH